MQSKTVTELRVIGETTVGKGYRCAEFQDCTVCYKRDFGITQEAKVVFLNGSDASLIASYSVRPQHRNLVSDIVFQSTAIPGYVRLDGERYVEASFANIYAYLNDFLSLGTLKYTGTWLAIGVAFSLSLCI